VVANLAAAIKRWQEEGREVVCLASSPEDDGQIIQLGQLTGGGVLPYLAGYTDSRAAMDLLASAGVVIGERLHACVLAVAASTPFVALEYRPKLRDFADSVDAGDLVLRTDQLTEGALLERVEEAIRRGTAAADEKTRIYRDRLHRASDLLRRATG
jgi:polysaccharide pyruvyl transferase WcaK-like protein